MKLDELISNTNDYDHSIERIRKVVSLIKPLSNKAILYRAMDYAQYRTVSFQKVTHDDREEFTAKTKYETQDEVLRILNIRHPIFCSTIAARWQGRGRWGGPKLINSIVIPGDNAVTYWSPNVLDLGSYGDKEGELEMETISDAKKLAATYETSWPKEGTEEVILSADYYYILGINQFVDKILGKKQREELKDLKKFGGKFKTYGDIAWWLENRFINYVEWMKERNEKQ